MMPGARKSTLRQGITTQPNVLFVFPDQWRGDWLGLTSDLPLRTPNIDALLKGGTGFARAWTPSPLCSPARSCLATERSYDRAPVQDNFANTPLDTPTFYSHLRQAGYRTASVGKSDLLKPAQSWGKDGRHRVAGIDGFAALGFSDGVDMAGKHDSAAAAKADCNDPYTDLLVRRGLIETYLADLGTRSVSTAVQLADWTNARVTTPPPSYANAAPSPLPSDAYLDHVIGAAAQQLIRDFGSEDPWFLMVNFAGPHEPLDVTQAMAEAWEEVDFPLPTGRTADDFALQQQIRRRYAAMLEEIDRWLGVMIEELKATGAYENTIIVFASDHGEMLGDRNLWQKQVPWEPSVCIPMIMAGPEIEPRGMVEHLPASLLDIPATLLGRSGASPMAGGEGCDLSAFLAGTADYPRHHATSGLGCWRAVTDGRWKLVLGHREDLRQGDIQRAHFDPADQTPGLLFDLESDPHETENLWGTSVTHRQRLLGKVGPCTADT